MKDALSKEIIIGNKYGYSQNNNGVTSVRVGIAEKVTSTGLLTLSVLKSGSAYGKYNIEINQSIKDKISVKSNLLFPVND